MHMNKTGTIADKIAMALDGHHTKAGSYGHVVLSARAWSKGGKSRVYIDARHVGTDHQISQRLEGRGYIEILGSGDLVYKLSNDREEIRRVAEQALSAELMRMV
jgi:hypothetical protein